jgi:hypothetical protein
MAAADILLFVGLNGISASGSGLGFGLLNGVMMMGESGRIGVNDSEVVKSVFSDDVSEKVGRSRCWVLVISGAKRPQLSLMYWLGFLASLITSC